KGQCYIALDVDEEPAVDVVDKMGADYFFVFTDYPHSDGAFTDAMKAFFGLAFGDEVRRRILWDNCASQYNIDSPAVRLVTTIVGLQARSDQTILYAADLVREGYIGEVLTANLSTVAQARLQRGPGRSWQGVRATGANTLSIAGGHAIDALCTVLGEFAEVS